MKPKKVICPICGEKMIARNWGMERRTYSDIGGAIYPGETYNYVSYFCPCGCEINYKGTKDCWKHEYICGYDIGCKNFVPKGN